MTPRPSGSSGESYDWLYDDGEKSSKRTQTGDLPPPHLPPPGQRRAGPRRPSTTKKRSWWRILRFVLLAWVIFLVAVPLWAWSQVDRVDAEPAGDRPANQLGTNYLIVGSDSRKGLTKEQQKKFATGGDSGGRGRTDTIMLLHVGSGPTLLLSIPRDSQVVVPGYGRTKINAAYSFGGPELLVRTVESATGIRVDNYVEIGFGGLVNVVNAVGGIEICPPKAIDDDDAGLDIEEGCQDVDGATALAYSRSRHSYATQDIQRIQSQREVIGAIADKVKSPWTILNPLRYFQTVTGAASSLRLGENVGILDAARFAFELSTAVTGGGLSCTVPLRDFAVTWDPQRAPKMFDLIKTDRTDEIGNLCTDDGLPKG